MFYDKEMMVSFLEDNAKLIWKPKPLNLQIGGRFNLDFNLISSL